MHLLWFLFARANPHAHKVRCEGDSYEVSAWAPVHRLTCVRPPCSCRQALLATTQWVVPIMGMRRGFLTEGESYYDYGHMYGHQHLPCHTIHARSLTMGMR